MILYYIILLDLIRTHPDKLKLNVNNFNDGFVNQN